jgi:drug/metabolite transporter (DMT)-like permease
LSRAWPHLAALAAVVAWGISFVATKAALRELTPATLVFSRFAMGAVLLHALLAVRRTPLLPPRERIPALLLMGFVGVFVHQTVQVEGLARTTAVRTGWLIGLIPIWSALLAAAFLRERFGARKVVGLALGFGGAALVVTRGRLSPELLGLPSTTGDLLILASTLNWAIYSALKRLETGRVAAYLYVEPLVTLAAAVTLLGEPVAATTLAGGLTVLLGVFLVQRG